MIPSYLIHAYFSLYYIPQLVGAAPSIFDLFFEELFHQDLSQQYDSHS